MRITTTNTNLCNILNRYFRDLKDVYDENKNISTINDSKKLTSILKEDKNEKMVLKTEKLSLYKDYRFTFTSSQTNSNAKPQTEGNSDKISEELSNKSKRGIMLESAGVLPINHYYDRFEMVYDKKHMGKSISLMAEEYNKVLNEINKKYDGEERYRHIKVLNDSFDWAVNDLMMEISGFLSSPQLERGYYFQDELYKISLTFSKANMDVDVYQLPSFEMGYMNEGRKLLEDIRCMFYNAKDYVLMNGSIEPACYDNITGASTSFTYEDLLIMDDDGIREEIKNFIYYSQKTDKTAEDKILNSINKSRLSVAAKNFFSSMIENTCEYFANDEEILNGYWDYIKQCGLTLAVLPEKARTYEAYYERRELGGLLF